MNNRNAKMTLLLTTSMERLMEVTDPFINQPWLSYSDWVEIFESKSEELLPVAEAEVLNAFLANHGAALAAFRRTISVRYHSFRDYTALFTGELRGDPADLRIIRDALLHLVRELKEGEVRFINFLEDDETGPLLDKFDCPCESWAKAAHSIPVWPPEVVEDNQAP